MNAWRGGFRGATVWDELGPITTFAKTSRSVGTEAALLVGADWCVVDSTLCDRLLQTHHETPDAMPLCFSQAPPGLSGLVVSTKLLEDLAQANRCFADVLAYNPARPAVDPISQEFNVAIPAEVRATARRFIYDTPEAMARLRSLVETRGEKEFCAADAETITTVSRQLEQANAEARLQHLPPICDVELTTRRVADGPITPQHYVDLDRKPMPLNHIERLADSLAGHAVTLGGIGEPLLHPDWPKAICIFREANAAAVALQTDLLVDDDRQPAEVAEAILDAEPDVVFVRLNAETAEVYAEAMGVDRFSFALATLQALFTGRAERAKREGATQALPLLVPTLTKTQTTVSSMEHFFERWWQLADHVVIHRAPQGGRGSYALAEDHNPVPMDPPWRVPDPLQYKHRLTVLSDGRVSLCHEDWLGRGTIGDLADGSLAELWHRFPQRAIDPDWRHDNSPWCPRCFGFAALHDAAATLTTA
ncbi:MAG: SPASM domain-containing protein [Planctomycetota bacterium]